MKFRKKALSVLTSAALATTMIHTEVVNATYQYGFEYNSQECTAKFLDGGIVTTYNGEGQVIGTMYYTLGRVRYKKKNSDGSRQDVFLVRMSMEPKAGVKSKNGELTYGYSQYLKTTVVVPTTSINDWEPKNSPKSSSWDIGLNIGLEGKTVTGGVSATTTVNKEQLYVVSNVQRNTDYNNSVVSFVYDYKPTGGLSFDATKNNYVKYASNQYAMISCNSKNGNYVGFKFQSNFGENKSEQLYPISLHDDDCSINESWKGSGYILWSFK